MRSTILSVSVLLFFGALGSVLNAQNDVASTSTSGPKEAWEYFDKKNTQPKAYKQYHEVKSFDKNDVLLKTEEVLHLRMEWNKTGKQQRTLRRKDLTGKEMPLGYIKLLEFYSEGELQSKEDFHASGIPAKKYDYHKGALERTEEYFDTADFNQVLKCKEHFFTDGTVAKRVINREDGKQTLSETFLEEGKTQERIETTYHKSGQLKSRISVVNSYHWQSKALEKTTNVVVEQDEKDLRTTTVDGVKTEEGTSKLIKQREAKTGEWKYWDANGKLLRVETWEEGKLKETREYK